MSTIILDTDRVLEDLRTCSYHVSVAVNDVDSALEVADRELPSFTDAMQIMRQGGQVRATVPFPFLEKSNALNHLVLSPHLLTIASEVLEASSLRLTSSMIQAKYGPAVGGSSDQTLHNDAWTPHRLLLPPSRARLNVIVYLSDVDETNAPLCIVGDASSVGAPIMSQEGDALYSRARYPNLYEQERMVTGPSGTVIIFLGEVVHRGTAVREERGERRNLLLNYHDALKTPWASTQQWLLGPADPRWPMFAAFISELTDEQRTVLGFPGPDSEYWRDPAVEAWLAKVYPRARFPTGR